MKTLLLILLLFKTTLAVPEPVPHQCSLSREAGPCKAALRRFYWDETAGKCKLFIYGGCKGNENNFETEQDCRRTCDPALAMCKEPPEVGRCYARIPRYYWNEKAGKCMIFFYGGCGGNENNFESEQECLRECKVEPLLPNINKCYEPAKTGPCRASIPRFYWDVKTGQCQKFIYGGCQANGNNFHTLIECRASCERENTYGSRGLADLIDEML